MRFLRFLSVVFLNSLINCFEKRPLRTSTLEEQRDTFRNMVLVEALNIGSCWVNDSFVLNSRYIIQNHGITKLPSSFRISCITPYRISIISTIFGIRISAEIVPITFNASTNIYVILRVNCMLMWLLRVPRLASVARSSFSLSAPITITFITTTVFF